MKSKKIWNVMFVTLASLSLVVALGTGCGGGGGGGSDRESHPDTDEVPEEPNGGEDPDTGDLPNPPSEEQAT